ncbi:MAG: VWA domain-containing protein [Chloroflexi bacterium]|nr:VWA domain-containing protein [Chloroflexota bacterium]
MMDRLIATIVARTRHHPDILRGASVRGAIAFKEVLQGFVQLQDTVTPEGIENAALVTLAPRIVTRQGDYQSALEVIRQIVREALYGMPYDEAEEEAVPGEIGEWLSPEEILKGLKNLEQLSRQQNPEMAQKGKTVVVPDQDKYRDLIQQLESKGFLQKGDGNSYQLTQKALQHLIKELEQKLKRGEISEEEYLREKGRLEEMMTAASRPGTRMSGQELSETVMELMDVQDRQWQKEISFEQMYIYYHIKSMSGKKELSPQKRDYYGLMVLIGDLKREGLIKDAESGEGFVLTGRALSALLKYLVSPASKGREVKEKASFGMVQLPERSLDIRKYSMGDVFRDISVRHTLREVVKQKKGLSQIRRSDLRVFMRRRSRLQSDVVLCVDTSGSMGYRHKLAYGRLAAAGLARAALEESGRVGVVTFDNFGKVNMPLTDKEAPLMDFIAGLRAVGNTNIGDGINCATQLLLRRPSKNQKHIVLVTDGRPNAVLENVVARFQPLKGRDSSEEYAVYETKRAAARGVSVSVVHVTDGDGNGDEFVKGLIKAGKGQLHKVACLEDLTPIIRARSHAL